MRIFVTRHGGLVELGSKIICFEVKKLCYCDLVFTIKAAVFFGLLLHPYYYALLIMLFFLGLTERCEIVHYDLPFNFTTIFQRTL